MEQNMKNIFSEFAMQMEKDVQYDGFSEQDLINKWTSKLLSLSNEFRKEKKKLSFKELYSETVLAVSDKKIDNVLFESIPTGLTALDEKLGGLPLGELIILGARPAMGKTAFLITMMANSINGKNVPMAYFSMEASAQYTMLRLISLVSEITYSRLVSKHLEPNEINTILNTTKILAEANITIEDNCFTIDDIIAETHFLVKEKGVKLIIIDYLQLVQTRSKMNREQEIAKVCRVLKSLAQKYNIAVFVSSQLSRAVETRGGDKKPQLSDLRESGAIEQDADKVLFLYRPEYYNIIEDCEGNSTQGLAEIIIAKNRGGLLDSAITKFVGAFSVFKDLEIPETTEIFELVDDFGISNPVKSFLSIRKDEFNSSTNPSSNMNDTEQNQPF
jgi:replicative DNA helicase